MELWITPLILVESASDIACVCVCVSVFFHKSNFNMFGSSVRRLPLSNISCIYKNIYKYHTYIQQKGCTSLRRKHWNKHEKLRHAPPLNPSKTLLPVPFRLGIWPGSLQFRQSKSAASPVSVLLPRPSHLVNPPPCHCKPIKDKTRTASLATFQSGV